MSGGEGGAFSPSNYVKDAADLYRDTEESGETRIIGVAFGTYIILEKDGRLYFIDFHAAHERILYDALMEKKEASRKPAPCFSADHGAFR